MNRLTKRTNEGIIIKGCKALEKLAKYEDLEEQGKLLILPIDEDTPVYSIEYCCGNDKNNKIGMCYKGFCENCSDKSYYIKIGKAKQCTLDQIGKSVFFTPEQTQHALDQLQSKDQNALKQERD